MVGLSDRLDGILGGKAAGLLDDVFGIRTVDDLLRHYPRKYIHGMSVWGEDEVPPEEGEHITLVGEIEKAEVRWTNRQPKREYLVITLGKGRRKVTATFFNAKYLKKELVEGVRLMLSGEVGFFKSNMQLTHPDFLVLESPEGTGVRQQVAQDDRRHLDVAERRADDVGIRTRLLPDLPGQLEAAELGHLRLRAAGARRARPDP